jgi:hypothetical protein
MQKAIYIFILLIISQASSSQICVGTQGQLQWSAWQNLGYPRIGELHAEEFYPQKPDVSSTIYRTQSPINYDNSMGGRIAGFIYVATTEVVQFNITGDDITRFYLSDDQDPNNLELIAYADGWSNIAEHDKYPTQTSTNITLTGGVYHYFEIEYVEINGGDHVTLYWKTDLEDPNTWTIINSNYLYDVDCLPSSCPERGTPCDDNDANTTEDKEDGHCNCMGTPASSNTCIGDQTKITAYAYDSIPGSNLNDLYNAPDYPGVPDNSTELDQLGISFSNDVDSTGNLVQAYISVPVTGNYKFNITGNNECIFFLSSDDDPANKQAHQILVTGGTDPTEHDKYIYQSTGPINLIAGQYYYIEINHKESTYSEHYSVFWQTPFTDTDVWKRIPDFYIYDYDCEIACIPQGVPCDDGDVYTNNDMYDANCECVGTPCSGPDCDSPLANYVAFDKCNTTDQLDNREDNNWLSCTAQASPNSMRADGHWIQYDLGQNYLVDQTHVWNYNVTGETDKGFNNVAIDVSLDGNSWTTIGTYTWPYASGSSDYSGFIGPDLMGVNARYILVSSLDPTSTCRGIGKIVFNVSYCPNVGATCDDGDPNTTNDLIDVNCDCVGNSVPLNDCDINVLSLGDTLLYTGNYSAISNVNSANLLSNNQDIKYIGGETVDMLEGFEVPIGTAFEVIIEPCTNTTTVIIPDRLKRVHNVADNDPLHVLPMPDSDYQIIEFHAMQSGRYVLDIIDKKGDVLYTIFNNDLLNKGIYTKRIRTKKLNTGVYQVHLHNDNISVYEKLVVL